MDITCSDNNDNNNPMDTNEIKDRMLKILVCPTTGGQFQVEVCQDDTVEQLRKKIARHLQMPRERLKVVFQQKVLSSGTISDNNIVDGNKVTLLPAVESGFSSTVQGTQQSIIHAIESLSDLQIDDFLSGRSPLTLALRVGDHMMFVQLQLEQSIPQNLATTTNSSTSSDQSAPSSSSNRSSTTSRTSTKRSSSSSSFYNYLPTGFHPSSPHCAVTPNTAHSTGIDYLPTSNMAADMSRYMQQSAGSSSRATSRPSSKDPPKLVLPLATAGAQRHLGRPSTAGDTAPVSAAGLSDAAGVLYKSPSVECSSIKRATLASLPHMADADGWDVNKIVAAYAPLSTDVLAAAAAAASSDKSDVSSRSSGSSQKASNKSPSRASSTTASVPRPDPNQNYHYRRATTTSGKITSGVGSLSHNGSTSAAGSRVVRQMQRLRRLCGAHQQCVAYSSPELASEISSIVHAAKHHSLSEAGYNSSGHRHHHCGSKRPRTERNRGVTSSSSSSSLPNTSSNTSATPSKGQTGKSDQQTVSGASIDSFTTHGPGIFSGTFSGSLHPNIQDVDGRPKRDPQTILQILTDLLCATDKYQGSVGDIGMLPQLLRDHFTKPSSTVSGTSAVTPNNLQPGSKSGAQPSGAGASASSSSSSADSQGSRISRNSGSASSGSSSSSKNRAQSCQNVYNQQHPLAPLPSHAALYNSFPYMHHAHGTTTPYQFNPHTTYHHHNHHYALNNGGLAPESCGHHHRFSGKCPHRHQQQHKLDTRSPYWCCCCAAGSTSRHRASSSTKQPVSINVARLQQKQEENNTTRNKMQHLTMMIKLRRMQRMQRRRRREAACSAAPYNKQQRSRSCAWGGGECGGRDDATPVERSPSPEMDEEMVDEEYDTSGRNSADSVAHEAGPVKV